MYGFGELKLKEKHVYSKLRQLKKKHRTNHPKPPSHNKQLRTSI